MFVAMNAVVEATPKNTDSTPTVTPTVFEQLPAARLIEIAVQRGEGVLSDTGALVVKTGARTGRSPADRFIVKEPTTEGEIEWGNVNRPFDEAKFVQNVHLIAVQKC